VVAPEGTCTDDGYAERRHGSYLTVSLGAGAGDSTAWRQRA
jgi:hypothetical protein